MNTPLLPANASIVRLTDLAQFRLRSVRLQQDDILYVPANPSVAIQTKPNGGSVALVFATFNNVDRWVPIADALGLYGLYKTPGLCALYAQQNQVCADIANALDLEEVVSVLAGRAFRVSSVISKEIDRMTPDGSTMRVQERVPVLTLCPSYPLAA